VLGNLFSFLGFYLKMKRAISHFTHAKWKSQLVTSSHVHQKQAPHLTWRRSWLT
jgi:hypothetical protein